ncbi:MAG TPA: ThuA domain-containing protein [Verrucomicrobiae bacterium]|nr:ThuA domain-containing protein [Verrucomicrobiae bacterium]
MVAASVGSGGTNVWMLVPGFTVQELPLQLPNVNNLRFAPDGRLTALGYNGKVWLLRDTNRDGLEDAAEPFWDRPTITVPVGMCWSTAGLFVSSSGKVSLLRDTDGDGKGDTEEIVASGWPEKEVASGNVDAMGVTMDKMGNLYFALLTANYANPYQIKDGVSHYDVNGKRGSVQKLNRKTRRMETIATGVRVPYNFALNKRGDLFMTDQEGETWCPNGNPLDELNHIIPGRNYGFPPRHEQWLPNLISEPPVVTFGPQHQSACGFVFNEPHGPINPKRASNSQFAIRNSQLALPASPGQGLFGPKWWEGDAFVAGESRGKIWRVQLVKRGRGYVGTESLIARLSMLTTDVTISPKGDLYVSCHSGLPDWGTGPNGEGKIFKISYTDPKAPQPVGSWLENARQVRVQFDKPLDPSVIKAVVGQEIEFGEYVREADRYEVLKPPYDVVKQQEAAPRGNLRITAARLEDNGKVLVLATEPHRGAATFALTIPGVKAKGSRGAGETVDIAYPAGEAAAPPGERPPPAPQREIVGGDYERGRDLFFGDRLKCATCHRIRGEGTGNGPDLSNLVSRDSASVLRDINEPGASINPDYVGYNLALHNGDELTGFVRNKDAATVAVIAIDGKETLVKPTDVKEMRPAGVSLMPSDLLNGLSESQVTDLLTFLLHEPPKRDKAEIEAILSESQDRRSESKNRNLTIVLVASKQDHGPGQHDYPAWQKQWMTLLGKASGVTVTSAWEWPTPEQFDRADALVFYYWNHDWSAERYQQLDRYQARGGGVAVFHSATIADREPEKLAERIGLAAQPGPTKYLHTPVTLNFVASTNHAIGRGFRQLKLLDEPYWPMIGDTNRIETLATADMDGEARPMIWTFQKGKGRVFASIMGHYTWTFDDPLFRTLALRGLAWAAGEPAHRFDDMPSEPLPDSQKASLRSP